MEKGVSGVYAITCQPTGRKYIGSSADIRERFFRHRYKLRSGKHHITAMQLDWNEHGEAAFTFQVLQLCASRDERFDAEQAAIDSARAAGRCYNPSPSSRNVRGYRATPGQRAAISAALRGRAVSEETRRKISESNRATWAEREITPEARERMAEMGRRGKGKPKSAETRRKMSEAQKGRPKNPESIAKMRATKTGRKLTDEHKAAISAGCRGKPCYVAKITADQAREIKRRLAAGEKGIVLAAEFGITPASVSAIKHGHSWAHVTV